MKIVKKIELVMVLCGISLMLTGCQHGDEEWQTVSEEIAFRSADTRALKESFETGDSFSVWGYSLIGDNVLSLQRDFENVEVEKKSASVWEYDNPRYWISARTYRFYALYPYASGESATLDTDLGTLSLPLSLAGAEHQQDFMTATPIQISYTQQEGVTPDPVAFDFNHRLAYVELCGREEVSSYGGGSVTVTRVSFYGMAGSATYSETIAGESTWTPASSLTTMDAPYLVDNRQTPLASLSAAQPTALFENGILALPGNITINYAFRIEYEIDFGGNKSYHETILRPATVAQVVPTWEAGKKYRYTFTVIDQDRILFDVPTVTPWGEDNEDIFIVE